MNVLHPHRFWIATLGFAVALMLASAPLLNWLREGEAKHLAELHAERTKTEQALKQLENDVAETQKLGGQIGSAEIEKFLAPADRLQAADALEKQAASARLGHFTYTLSPEQKISVGGTGAGAQELALSTITVKADAPLDTDAYAFAEKLRRLLPGRLRMKQMTLERIAAAAPPAVDNLRLTATFEWLSNGVGKQMAEGR